MQAPFPWFGWKRRIAADVWQRFGDVANYYDCFERLAACLRTVRVTCGYWSRIVTDSVTIRHGITGVLLDRPYGDEIKQDRTVYAIDVPDISRQARRWCAERGDDSRLRIALCGYGRISRRAVIAEGLRRSAARVPLGCGRHER